MENMKIINGYVMLCTIWYHFYNFKNVKNTQGGAQHITYKSFQSKLILKRAYNVSSAAENVGKRIKCIINPFRSIFPWVPLVFYLRKRLVFCHLQRAYRSSHYKYSAKKVFLKISQFGCRNGALVGKKWINSDGLLSYCNSYLYLA